MKNMHEMGFPWHIILLWKAMYDKQKAAVKTTYGLTEWLRIEQRARQGCMLSPHLVLYSETIMRKHLVLKEQPQSMDTQSQT